MRSSLGEVRVGRSIRRRLPLLFFFVALCGFFVAVCGGRGALADDSAWAGTPQEAFFDSPVQQRYLCVTCHTIMERGGTVGPVLNQVGRRRPEEWLRRWLTDPQAVKPGTKMPTFAFTPEEFEQVVASLSRLTRPVPTAAILGGDGTPAEKGEVLFRGYDCYGCHRIGGEGRFVGPDLTWIGVRKSRAWEREWLHDPDAFKPGTFMPDFRLTDPEVDAVSAFLERQRGERNEEAQEWEFNMNFFLTNDADEAGELIFKRVACWSCHGERGKGGVRNPNMAPDELIPPIKRATLDYTLDALRTRLSTRRVPEALRADQPPPPFDCPPLAEALTEDEFSLLYAYLKTLAPRKREWKFK